MTTTDFLHRPGGRVALRSSGAGPLVVAVPGMGDLTGSYRDLAGPVVEAGYRLVLADLRGHGASDTTFREHGDEATAGDLVALLESAGEPGVLVGNSMSASAAVLAAARRPDLVAGLVLICPFLRPTGPRWADPLLRTAFRVLLARPWGARAWTAFYARLNRGRTAPWLPAHLGELRASFRDPARLGQFRRLAVSLDHSVVPPVLPGVSAPALLVVGELDPDYPDPAAELSWMARQLPSETFLVPDAGHYPHAQRADLVAPRVVEFLHRVHPVAGTPVAGTPAAGTATAGSPDATPVGSTGA
ncbi:alpha/beta hydrolase [Paenibacillus sp. TRM 82003]|uniref:alpha/beta fold hydrolase n=1 Tax=Kineococcus sp. TRM81007 TaxID=2925831 RepID=UPI001F599EF5|nr:alpha/beta hydrolase [Kineococcus sp. TRM81007]MCI2239369.1 alpha/beta hydrolase [Kineococcus sp. TRM81007]MCI3925051.1 alpha/beta hydrolase [Paenibacillus sp. TRM 82003]